MKILALRRADAFRKFRLLENVPEDVTLETVFLSRDEQKNLKLYFENISFTGYEFIFFDLKWSLIYKQIKFIKTIPNLVIYEHDSVQNFMPESRYHKTFQKFYRKLPYQRIICTGYGVSKKFHDLGIDTHFISKYYDENNIVNNHQQRTIEHAFIGTLNNSIYHQRKKLLTSIAEEINLSINTTQTVDEYNQLLNNVNFFISADIGINEYMIKNFEALAAGCILVCYCIPSEIEKLGFKDMHNVILYNSPEEAVTKITQVAQDIELHDEISRNGCRLAKEKFTLEKHDENIFSYFKQLKSQNTAITEYSLKAKIIGFIKDNTNLI